MRSIGRYYLFALVPLSVFAVAGSAQAAMVTWDGGSTVPTTNWTDGGNWAGDVAPVATDSLVFDGGTQPTNVNDYAAGTQFNGVTWAATSTANWTQSGNSINLAGDLVYSRTAGSATTTTPFVLQQNINVDVASGGTLNLNGAISGGSAITKTGAGLATTAVAFTQAGGLNVNGGIFRTTVSGNTTASLGTGTISFDNNAVLELRSTTATTFNNALVLNAGGGTIDERSNHTFSPSSISGAGPLTLRPTGADNLVFTATDMKGWNGQIYVDRNGRNNFGLRLATAFVNNSLANAAIDLRDNTFISRQNGTNQNGTTVIDIGSLSSSVSNSSIGGSASGTGYFIYSIGSRNENTTFAGNVIDGSTRTALRKVGTAEMVLSGAANTFSGPSSVDAGKLTVNGTLSSAALSLTVNSGGTLKGSGSIAGAVTVADGGTLAPGTSSGTLTVNNAVVLNPMSSLAYDLTGTDTTVGGGVNDLLTGVTNLTLDGTLNVTETTAGSFLSASAGQKWRLITYGGTLTDNILDIGTMPALQSGLGFVIENLTGQVNILVVSTAVPEPKAFLFGGLVCCVTGAAYVLRRRRAQALSVVRA